MTALYSEAIATFDVLFDEALTAGEPDRTAMVVATATRDARPSARIVLLKAHDARGFVFYTHLDGRKGRELQANPHAALLFHWVELERQVRIEGRVAKLPDAESDAYFQSRPLKSRLGAIASAQSEPIASREALEQRFAEAEAVHGEQPVRPAHWGGYRLVPDRIEFWQGRPSRLHDRILYTRGADGGWRRERLQP